MNNEALVRASYGVPDLAEAAHLAACAECAAAVAALDARRTREAGECAAVEQLSDAFWQRQRHAILASIRQPAVPAFRPAAAAFSLAALLLLALLLVGQAPRVPPTAKAPSRPAEFFRAEDEQLLREIHSLVNRVEPRALAPAALLLPDQSKEVRQQ